MFLAQVVRSTRHLVATRALRQSLGVSTNTTPFNSSTRRYATPPPQLNYSSLSTEEYHRLSDKVMDKLLTSLEELIDNIGEDSYEVEYSSGVLTLKLGAHGTYVINKQPPNKQIWLSSPVSGPQRYDYCPDRQVWYYKRDGRLLSELLGDELSAALQHRVHLGIEELGPSVK